MSDPTRGREIARSVLFFLLTFASVWITYAIGQGSGEAPDVPAAARDGFLFAAGLMAVLLAHELGHYFVARHHGFELSPPLFIPMPFGFFGTLGAVIRLRSLPRSRQALLEMGAAGPLAGAVVAFALIWFFLPDFRPTPEIPPGAALTYFNDPLVAKLVGVIRLGAPPPLEANWHPAAFAGWVGCFLTGINLVPIGQLDGGHVLGALAPRLAPRITPLLVGLALVGSWFFLGWAFWAVVLVLLGATRPLPVPAEDALPARSRLVAVATAALFVLTFLPVPIVGQGLLTVLGGGAGAG